MTCSIPFHHCGGSPLERIDEVAGPGGDDTPLVAFHTPRLAALHGSGSLVYAGAGTLGEDGAAAGPRGGGGKVDFTVELWSALTSSAIDCGNSFFWARD